jgi:hypothetical protein
VSSIGGITDPEPKITTRSRSEAINTTELKGKMANSPPFAASNSFVETPLRRMVFQTGFFGKTLVLLTGEDIIEFMSEKK